jgi:tRNA(His) 5'-end guanylyltransferase
MKFDELESKMRAYESARDPCAIPGVFLVARIDGRSFTRLTKEVCDFEKPFDIRFRDHMLATVEHVMTCGFAMLYGYTQSDEISLLFDPVDACFGRNIRKLTSVLAGEASAAFSVRLGRPASFDCRIIELPSRQAVIDYFRWRHEDAHRNALNGWCYWKLRGEGVGMTEATKRMERLSIPDKNELLFQRGVNFNDLPMWQRRGVGLVWESFEKPATNPKTGEHVTAIRRRLRHITDLPMKDEYSAMIGAFLDGSDGDRITSRAPEGKP